jgi:hypothetical protein
MSDSVSQISIEEQVQCAERELEKRMKFYPKWVSEGRMNQLKADREIAGMEAIIESLKQVKEPRLL